MLDGGKNNVRYYFLYYVLSLFMSFLSTDAAAAAAAAMLFSFHSSIHLSAVAMAATGGKARQGKKEVLDGGKNDVRYFFLSHLLFFPSCLFFPQTRRRQRQRQRYFSLFLHPSNYPYIHPSIHPSAALAGAAGINNIGGRRRKVSKCLVSSSGQLRG